VIGIESQILIGVNGDGEKEVKEAGKSKGQQMIIDNSWIKCLQEERRMYGEIDKERSKAISNKREWENFGGKRSILILMDVVKQKTNLG
jgi:hypothetical protein